MVRRELKTLAFAFIPKDDPRYLLESITLCTLLSFAEDAFSPPLSSTTLRGGRGFRVYT